MDFAYATLLRNPVLDKGHSYYIKSPTNYAFQNHRIFLLLLHRLHYCIVTQNKDTENPSAFLGRVQYSNLLESILEYYHCK